MSLLSIVIPVYNAEDVLSCSMNSLLNRTVKDFDIILVDDGSTDNSAKICDKYSNDNERVSVVHKTNGGLASSRNAGIKAARTEYIAFLDADDFFSETFVEDVLEIIKNYNPDCIYFGWQYVTKEGIQPGKIADLTKNVILDKDYLHKVIIPPMLNLIDDKDHFIDNFAWNKIYRTDLIKQYSVAFDENRRIWEDRVFVVEYLRYCDTFYCMDKAYYNYVQVAGSLASKYYLNMFDIVLDSYNKYFKWFSGEYDFNTSFANTYYCHVIENVIYRSLEQSDYTEEIHANIIRTLKNENVVSWYQNRVPENVNEMRLSQYVLNQEYEEAIQLYRSIFIKQKRISKKQNRIFSIKSKIKHILGR